MSKVVGKRSEWWLILIREVVNHNEKRMGNRSINSFDTLNFQWDTNLEYKYSFYNICFILLDYIIWVNPLLIPLCWKQNDVGTKKCTSQSIILKLFTDSSK